MRAPGNAGQADHVTSTGRGLRDLKVRASPEAIPYVHLTTSQVGMMSSASVLAIHERQNIERRPVGAEPAAETSSSHNTRKTANTTTVTPRLALSIQIGLYQRRIAGGLV
jgi:hypothetical protein